MAFAGCVDKAADRQAKDTLPSVSLAGSGEAVAIAQCVYDAVLSRDCQTEQQRLLITKAMNSSDIIVMCDENLGYAGVRGGGYYGGGSPAGALGGAIAEALSVSQQAAQARDPTKFPVYSVTLRSKPAGGVDGEAWALNEPDKGPRRLNMMIDAFNKCSAAK
ncbi:hypothetical protein DKG74_11945 [Zavarzinia aquatilis]|uniref:Uncharacterized protein n=2 Tax=Zavarzinia aquatilis TaxID=2211142 RepID=A0A317E6C1_9PROT|nr:hypothetical protein DKG74_11945 [Zavarzinia aquatilis]